MTITATDAAGHSHSYSETFDTFSQNNFMIEAGDFDFNGGQWIDNPLETATLNGATNSYSTIRGTIRPMGRFTVWISP